MVVNPFGSLRNGKQLQILAWIKKPFQLLDRTGESLFNYGTAHPLFASVLIYILVATTVFFNFYFHPDGLVWGDGYYYLSTAKSIANGELWQDGIYGAFDKMNPLWPIGYPALIGYLSKLTGIGVFWSSKTINLIALAGMIGILYKWFYPVGWIYSLCFFNAAVMEVISLTLSETVFLLGLLTFLILLKNIINQPYKAWHYFFLSLVLVYLVLTRYVGGFAFLVCGFFAIHYWPRIRSNWFKLLTSLGVSSLIIGIYLGGNYLVYGHPFGERPMELISPVKVLQSLLTSGIMMLNFPINLSFYDLKWIAIVFALQALALIYLFKNDEKLVSVYPTRLSYRDLSTLSLLIFAVYSLSLFIAITIRSTGDFFNYRLLTPAFFFGSLCVVGYFQSNSFLRIKFKSFTKAITVIAIGSFLLNLPIKLGYRYGLIDKPIVTYSDKIELIESKYQDLSKSTGVVINGSRHLSYTRSNLRPIELGALYDDGHKLKVKYLRALVEKHKQVLLNISPKHSLKPTFEKHGFLLKLKSNKGLLNLYEIKESTS